jgi:hypothetical protein
MTKARAAVARNADDFVGTYILIQVKKFLPASLSAAVIMFDGKRYACFLFFSAGLPRPHGSAGVVE